MANVTWNPSDKTASAALSNGNLTIVTSANNQAIRATDRQATGKFYFEVTCTTIGVNFGVGLNTAQALPAGGAITGTILIVSGGGLIYLNGTSTGITIGTITSGTLLGLAFDIGNQLAWFRVGAAGNWNGNVVNNPATGVGGVSFASLPNPTIFPYYPYAAINNTASTVTANFGDTAFTGTVPSGFTSGFTAGATITNYELATQLAGETWALPTTQTLQLTQIAIEEWATVATTNPQLALTQIAIEEWASVLLITPSVGAPMITMIG